MATPPYDPALANQVLQLRRAGVQFDAIADRLNLTVKSAKALFDKALGSFDPELSTALEADRLDRLHLAVWPAAQQGDVNAIDRVLKISERREKVVAVPKENDHALRIAFDQSAQTSEELHPGQDAALVAAGRRIADRVDEAVATGEGQELTKALYLVPHMLNVLREMLATPAARALAEKGVPPAPPKTESKVAQLRAIQGARKSG